MREYFTSNFKHKNTVYLKSNTQIYCIPKKPWPTVITKLQSNLAFGVGFRDSGFSANLLKANPGLKNSLGPRDPKRIDRAE